VSLVLDQVAKIVAQAPVTLVLKDDARIAGILSGRAGRLAPPCTRRRPRCRRIRRC